MNKPKECFWALPQPQKYPIRAQKVKNDLKIKSTPYVRIVFETFPNQEWPKIKSKSNVRI